MMKSIPSTRQLATDSALGTPIRNGTRRYAKMLSASHSQQRRVSIPSLRVLGDMKVSRGTSDKELTSRFSE
jgi:hypothetical protein